MKAISFCGHEFVLHPCGLLIWPRENLAIVSDLHLEKASYYAQRGQFLPPYESYETLRKLSNDLQLCDIRKVIFLGDSFHDPAGYARLDDLSKALLAKLSSLYELIWVTGNHDKGFLPDGSDMAEELTIQNIIFRHEAIIGEQGEISGHYHPKMRINLKGQRLNHPCFIADDHKMILPAYGTLTGGMDITLPPFDKLFPEKYTAYVLGKNKIYSIPASYIQR